MLLYTGKPQRRVGETNQYVLSVPFSLRRHYPDQVLATSEKEAKGMFSARYFRAPLFWFLGAKVWKIIGFAITEEDNSVLGNDTIHCLYSILQPFFA